MVERDVPPYEDTPEGQLAWERDCAASVERLGRDPAALADYQKESDLLGNAATEVIE